MKEKTNEEGELEEMAVDYIKLCELLHENANGIPANTWKKIEDLIYRWFEP